MTENDFWGSMARRINAELAGSRDNNIRFLAVDDILPDAIEDRSDAVIATGIAWVFAGGRSNVTYRFSCHLGVEAAAAYRAGRWDDAVVPANATGWVTIDRRVKEISVSLA